MADNTQTLKTWQEAASATKDCLPLEVLERMTDNTSPSTQKPRPIWPAARTARLSFPC